MSYLRELLRSEVSVFVVLIENHNLVVHVVSSFVRAVQHHLL